MSDKVTPRSLIEEDSVRQIARVLSLKTTVSLISVTEEESVRQSPLSFVAEEDSVRKSTPDFCH